MLALDVWVFRTRFGDTISSTVTFWLPVDLVILFEPEWIDKLFQWLYMALYSTARAPCRSSL